MFFSLITQTFSQDYTNKIEGVKNEALNDGNDATIFAVIEFYKRHSNNQF
jgi:hypothetical protein